MARWWRPNTCERTAQWISLELDGELSPFERVALERHLSGCLRCREVSAEFAAFTRMLREAPLIQLERKVPRVAPRRARGRIARRTGLAVAFAGIAAAAVLGGFAVSSPSTPVSALAFQSLAQQQLYADIEVRRLEPVVFRPDGQPRCIGRCTLN